MNSSIPYWSGSSKDTEQRSKTTFIPYPFLISVSISKRFRPQTRNTRLVDGSWNKKISVLTTNTHDSVGKYQKNEPNLIDWCMRGRSVAPLCWSGDGGDVELCNGGCRKSCRGVARLAAASLWRAEAIMNPTPQQGRCSDGKKEPTICEMWSHCVE